MHSESVQSSTNVEKHALRAGSSIWTIQRGKDIIDMLQNTVIHLSWIPGEENDADLVHKVFLDPISIVNSEFYRREEFMCMDNHQGAVFMTIDNNGVGVPDHITIYADNAKKLNLLTGARAEDKMGNKDNERKDELEMQKCELCYMHYEMCGTYLATRANTYDKKCRCPKHIELRARMEEM